MAKDLVYDVYRHCTVYKRINNVTRSEMTETLFASSAMPLAYSPVDISGVDTSGLAVLKESEKIELLKKCRAGDKQAREKLISGNPRLVLSVIQKFMGRGENSDDLFQVGCIGIIKAIENFNTELDVRFSTYAVLMICRGFNTNNQLFYR